jgi:CubicO group peptidase (beta-lactamase class C family)
MEDKMKNRELNRKTQIIALIQIVAAIIVPTTHALDLKPKIDPLAQPLIEDSMAVGLIIGVVKDNQTQVIAYGEKTKGSNVLPDADTVYEIGSISKVFTGILLADMVRKGIVKLEDPVQKYLPPGVKMPVADDKPITLEHIVTHTSGLPRLPDNFAPADPTNPYADYSESQMFEFLNGHKLRRPPGQYEYSNYAMGLLGHLIARKMGKSYEQYLIDQICIPVGMGDTSIVLNDDQRTRLATPYDGVLNPVNTWEIPTLAGAGGIRSTCNDMMDFIKVNLKSDNTPFTQALRMSHQKRHTIGGGMAIGMAWHINPDGIRWHNGGTGGFHSWLGISPDQNVGVVVLVNTSNMRFTQFGEKVMQVALGQDVEPMEIRKVIDVSPDVLETYAGVYTLAPNFNLTVTLEEGKLMLQATGQGKYQVFPESRTKFFLKVVDAQISFILSKDGKVDHLVLHQGGIDQKAFPRKAIEVSPNVLESYVGVYKVPSTNSTLTVTVEDGRLMVQAAGEEKKQVFPESKTRFFYKEMESIQISFFPDEDGGINRLIVHVGSKEYQGFRENDDRGE